MKPLPATRCGKPAHIGALPRVTASMIAQHGSYAEARRVLANSARKPGSAGQ